MLRDEFMRCLLSELWLLGQPFDRWAVESFVASCWPWIEEDPCVSRWARKLLAASRADTESVAAE